MNRTHSSFDMPVSLKYCPFLSMQWHHVHTYCPLSQPSILFHVANCDELPRPSLCTNIVFGIFRKCDLASDLLSLNYMNCATVLSSLPKYAVPHLRHKLIVIIGPHLGLCISSMTSLFVNKFYSHRLPSQTCSTFRFTLSMLAGTLIAVQFKRCVLHQKTVFVTFFGSRTVDHCWGYPFFICVPLLSFP